VFAAVCGLQNLETLHEVMAASRFDPPPSAGATDFEEDPPVKKFGYLTLMVTISLMLAATALAQGDPSYYFTTYYSNANTASAPDATVRVINDGDTGANLFAAIYVFDDSEELQECCACVITPDGLLSESVNKNLTANPLTGIKPTRGVIKVISSTSSDPANTVTQTGLRAWGTHVQKLANGFAFTETLFADSNLVPSEQTLLNSLCKFDYLLSGKPCTCTPEDSDF